MPLSLSRVCQCASMLLVCFHVSIDKVVCVCGVCECVHVCECLCVCDCVCVLSVLVWDFGHRTSKKSALIERYQCNQANEC